MEGWQTVPNTEKLRWMDRYVRPGKLLDLGAGKGWYSSYAAAHGCEVYAIDSCIQIAQPNIEILQQTLEEPLPFQDEFFDTVLAWDIIEHIDNDAQLLTEIGRVLKKEGALLLSVPHANDDVLARRHLTYCHFKDRSHKREYLPLELDAVLSAVGLCSEEIRLVGGGMYPFLVCDFIEWRPLRALATYTVSAGLKLGLIKVGCCHGDIFVACKNRGRA